MYSLRGIQIVGRLDLALGGWGLGECLVTVSETCL